MRKKLHEEMVANKIYERFVKEKLTDKSLEDLTMNDIA